MGTVLVTGGSFGLGRAMAAELVARGHDVWICGRRQSRLDETCASLPGVQAVRCDLGDPSDRQRLIDAVTAAGPLDILVNNAAVSHSHDFTDPFTLGTDRSGEEIATNLHAPIDLARLFLDWRRRSGNDDRPGTIAMISTPGAFFPLEANPLYCATKAGLHLFTRALRYQLRATPVQVVEVFPPALATGLTVEMEVQAEADNGDEAVTTVAIASVDGILAGEVTVLPHPQAAKLVGRFARDFPDSFMEAMSSGVQRRPGWNVEHVEPPASG